MGSRHSRRFSRLDVTPMSPPIMSSATRSRSETTASARQGVASSGTNPRQSRTPRTLDDDPDYSRPGMGADPILGVPQPVPGLESDVGLRQAMARPEAGRPHPADRA